MKLAWFMLGVATATLVFAVVAVARDVMRKPPVTRECKCVNAPDHPIHIPEAKPHWLEKET